MKFFKSWRVLSGLIAVLALSSCRFEAPPLTVTVAPGTIGTSLTCAATTSLNQVVSGQSFPVTIQVIGGAGPYSLSGFSGSFLTTYTIPQTLTNTGDNSQVTTTRFTVTDSGGRSTTCQLAITVVPEDSTDPLSCTVAASTTTPNINQSVTYTATAAGGGSTYFFTGFIPGGTGVITASLNQINTTQATAGARYSAAGLNTAVFYISDSLGNSATCARTVTVQSGPTVSLTATPASTVPATSAMTITATATNFSSTPTFTYSIAGSGLNLSASGAVATVTAVDALVTRTGTVTVVATAGSQTATSSIPVTFTAGSSTLNCSITYPAGAYYPGDTVPYSITASTGESLIVTELYVQDGYVVGGTASQNPNIRFYSAGYKSVTARARSASTGILCNAGALLQSTIEISSSSSTFTCTLSMTPNPTYTDTWILATVTGSGAQGSYWLESLTAERPEYFTMDQNYSTTFDSMFAPGPIYRYVYFTYPGTWRVTARIVDQAGRRATCYTNEVIYW
ncbi:hypothetical protein EBQ90_08240 [bacterium]|nr:hypothetical protein [bacterium]